MLEFESELYTTELAMWPFVEKYPEKSGRDVDGREYDYVIVGGGTAGAVVASKLSEDPNVSVLVLERGSINDTWTSRVPLISSDFTSDSSPAIMDHRSRPLVNRGGYQLSLLSAHLLGGNSRINSSISTRGMPGGYNQWAEDLGLTDWSWERVEPYFKKLESSGEDDPSRGSSGPVRIRQVPDSYAFTSYLEKAYSALGLPSSESINSATTPSQTYAKLEVAIGEKGQRVSSYSAFLNAKIANERRSHLTVCTNTVVTKLAFSDDRQTVTGVHCRQTRSKRGEKVGPDCFVKVRREVIVSAGAFVSPLILMHSGIGPAEVLKKHGISQIKELPVGQTLQDHLLFGITLEVPQSESIHRLQSSIFLALWHFLSYIIWGTGALAGPPTPRAAWINTSHLDESTMKIKPTDEQGNSTSDPLSKTNIPDVEIMSLACSMLDRTLPGHSVISLLNCLAQPTSNGSLELTSNDPEDYADVSFPYLTDVRDVITARKSMRFTMRVADEFLKSSGYPHGASILTAPSINRLPKDWEKSDFGEVKRLAITPDPAGRAKPLPSAIRAIIPRSEVEKTWESVSDEEIDTFVRNTAISGNHPASTCRMSVDPKDGVVDQRFKVHGMKNLRVADASALPKLPTGHLMLPVMMFGLRCADFVREDWEGYGH